jgi:hypothetical protein
MHGKSGKVVGESSRANSFYVTSIIQLLMMLPFDREYFYFFDLLIVNQHTHTDSVVPAETLRDTFASGVLGAGRTLLVMDAAATPMTRLWCVFELAVSLQHRDRVSYEVIMPRHETAAFRAQLLHDYASKQ